MLNIAVFGLVFSRLAAIDYVSYIVPGVVSTYPVILTIYPVGTLIHYAMGRAGYYSYILPVPRWSIVAVRVVISMIIVAIASINTLISYYVITGSVSLGLAIVFLPATALTISISLLYASLAYIIRDVPKYFSTIPSLSTILSILSTAYYPPASLSHLPSVLRDIAVLNPVSVSADISRIYLRVAEGEIMTKTLILAIESLAISIPSSMILARKLKI